MPLPKNAREELEARIEVLERDARDFRNHAKEARTLAGSHDDRAAEYEDRAAEIKAILKLAYPEGQAHVHWKIRTRDEAVYDQGGILEPSRPSVKLNARPEPVLTAEQCNQFAEGKPTPPL